MVFFGLFLVKGYQGLCCIDMEKGYEFRDFVLGVLIVYLGEMIEWLSFFGWKEVVFEVLNVLVRCKNFKYLDVGWCWVVNNFWVKDVLDGCYVIE